MIKNYFKKAVSLLLCTLIVATALPITSMAASSKTVTAIADNGTAHTFESIMGTDIDGNRYAGRVWVDKSVYTDGQTAVLNTSGDEGSTFKVNLEQGENFQTIFSALGSSMTTKATVSSSGPLDVVIILDDSTSMDDIISGRTTRLEKLIESSNKLLADLLTAKDIRIGIVGYNQNSIEILPFGKYENGIKLSVLNNKYTFDEWNNTDKGGTIRAFDNSNMLLHNNTKGYARGTNVQAGFDMGMRMLENVTNTEGRTPVAILLTDGSANTAAVNNFYNISGQTPHSIFNGSVAPGVALVTMLTAAYRKARVEKVYSKAPTIYGIGVDLDGDAAANAIINPAATKNGFNARNSNYYITQAYDLYVNTWLKGRNATRTESYNGNHTFVANHSYPAGSNITDADVAANINYVDKYYDVSSAQLDDTFNSIYEELFSGAFNPITSTETVDGATGVKDTPLLYVDHIGKYMEVKNVQAVTLFGKSYAVTNAGGRYTVQYAKGTNPTTNEEYETSEDIKIEILDNASDGTQRLEIKINQEILPILLEQVSSETVGNKTTATINELTYGPLRVYYTVGVKSDILLPNGEIDLTKIEKAYSGLDLNKGELTLYSNQFGTTTAELDSNGNPVRRDAHVGFKPSAENRYYYHQSNQGIFTKIKDEDGDEVTIPPNQEYGIVWNEDAYTLDWMTYDEYLNTSEDTLVYTYVNYYRPTESAADNANAAERVTYLVYTEWKYLKSSAAFYDATTKKYVNYDATAGYTLDDIGHVMTERQIAEYVRQNPNADIYAVLGVGSMRTSRFHNMTFDKEVNATGTNSIRYEPQYTEGMAANHHGNDVVVWLGNNGKLTLPLTTGVALSKAATEAIGNADDTYTLTLKIDSMPSGGVVAPTVHDINGNEVPFIFNNDTVKVQVKVGETVWVSGIPAGSICTVGEEIPQGADFRVDSISSKTVTIPTVSEVMDRTKDQYVAVTVTNTLNKYGNLFITKELQSDHAIPDSILSEDFAFELNGGAALADKSFNVADSKNKTSQVTFDENGRATVYISARQTLEILNIPENTVVTLTEKLTAAQAELFKGVKYRARNHSGEDATETTNEAIVTIPSTGSATAVVINTYAPKSTTASLDIAITKKFADASVANKLLGGEFNFLVQKYNSDNKDWEDIASETIKYLANEYGEKSVNIANVLKNEVYTEIGRYSYQVLEVRGNVANVSYDRTIYTFDVIVVDNGGQLVATVLDNTSNNIGSVYNVEFNNTYDTAPISMDITKAINNLSGDDTVSAAGFKFRSINVDANGNPLPANQPETATNTIFSDAAGMARISGVYTRTQIGTHHYLVYEEDEGKAGWSYSKAQYLVTVNVAEDNSGKLVADMSIVPFNDAARAEKAPTVGANNKGQLYFTNTYDPADEVVDVDALVKKSLEGKTLNAGDFTFELYENGKTTALLRGTNDANGNIDFKAVDANNPLTQNDVLNFTSVGKYEFDIKEVAPLGGVKDGITYDTTIYDLVVEVENDITTGKLKATYYFEDSTSIPVTFKNYYNVAPTTYKLSGNKTLNGRPMQVGEFGFTLRKDSPLNPPIETVRNKLDGSFEFSEITYTDAGVYNYVILEEVPTGASYNPATNKFSLNGVTYDTHQINVTVTVTDNGDGTLTASANVANTQIAFANSYKAAPTTVTFKGTKEFKGATLNANDFAFRLYQTDHTLNLNGVNPLQTVYNGANGEFAFETITYTEPGTYFYVIDEDDTYNTKDEVVYDTTEHGYRVQVRDYGTGRLIATVMDMDTGSTETDNANITCSFVNATFDEATEKEVAKQENAVAKIDGEFVEAGEILTYYIYYYNYTGKEATVEISDTIPAYTSYVDGSASHGGVYSGGNIDWILTVPRGRSVMVQFSVKVDESDSIVANTAIVRDGKNTYKTNTVNNHSFKDPVKKDVVNPDNVDLTINGKKVYEGDKLLYTISYTNTSYNLVDVKITDEIPEYTTYVDGSADNGGTFANGEVVWEIEDVQPWTTVTVAFMVTVDENIGAITIENKAVVNAGNTYETNTVTNHTVEDEVKKDVFLAKDETVSVDGKEIKAGDELRYEISYKNTDTEEATVTITDTIPENTTYVEGSATNGGVYVDRVITWNIIIPADESVTVSFKVTVGDKEGVEITNTATASEGKNTYTTNSVTTTTEITPPPEEKPPVEEEPPVNEEKPPVVEDETPIAPENPKTGDYTNLAMLIAFAFVSGAVLFGSQLIGKKKKAD